MSDVSSLSFVPGVVPSFEIPVLYGDQTTFFGLTSLVEVIVKPLGDDTCDAFELFPYVHTVLNVGSDAVDIPALQEAYEHLSILDPVNYSYASVELIPGQDV